MSYPLDNHMGQDMSPQSKVEPETRAQSAPTKSSGIETDGRSSGNKRAASETLEQNVTKAAKLTKGKDDDTRPKTEVKGELDPRDEKIAVLEKKIKAKVAEISRLEAELEEMTEERDEHQGRVHELEARETKRIEKERVVETDMRSTMKLASKTLMAQLRVDAQEKEKGLKEKYDLKSDRMKGACDKAIADFKAKEAEKTKRIEEKLKDKLQDSEDLRKQEKADHKQEIKELKDKQKEEVKSYKPDHSQAMKERAKELRAKDKEIADLKKATEDIDALMVEREQQANQLESAGLKIRELRQDNKTIQQDKADMEGQYNLRIEHQGRQWKIQNDAAEDAKNQLMIQQRSNFALRAESNVRNNRMQALQHQLQASQQQPQVATTDVAVQSNNSTLDTAVQTSSEVNVINSASTENEVTVVPELH